MVFNMNALQRLTRFDNTPPDALWASFRDEMIADIDAVSTKSHSKPSAGRAVVDDDSDRRVLVK
jgi:hypothetical protein